MDLGFGTGEHDKQYNHRNIVVAEEVLNIILYILSFKYNGFREAPSSFYIYLSYLYGLYRSLYE